MTKAPPKYIAEINLIHLIYQRDLFPAQNQNFPPYAYLAFNICSRKNLTILSNSTNSVLQSVIQVLNCPIFGTQTLLIQSDSPTFPTKTPA